MADKFITQGAIEKYGADIKRLSRFYHGLFVSGRQNCDVDCSDLEQASNIAVWNISRKRPEMLSIRSYVKAAIKYAIFSEMKKMRHKGKQVYLARQYEEEVQIVDVLPTQDQNSERLTDHKELLYRIKQEFSPQDAEGLNALLENCDDVYDLNLSEPPSTEIKERVRIVTEMDLSSEERLIYAQVLLGVRKRFPLHPITEKRKRLIEELYAQQLPLEEIAEKVGISYSIVCGHILLRTNPETGKLFGSRSEYREYLTKQKINPETGERFASHNEYLIYLAKQKGFASYGEYQEHLVKQRINPETGERFASMSEHREHLAKQRGFASYGEYQEHLVKQRINPETGERFASMSEHQEYLAKQKGFASKSKRAEDSVKQRTNPETGETFRTYNEYQRHLVKQRINPETGEQFASHNEYKEYLARQRQQQPINQKLSNLIKQRLIELGKTQRWLAQELGTTESSVSEYITGKSIPRQNMQKSLFETLRLPYQTLDDLLK